MLLDSKGQAIRPSSDTEVVPVLGRVEREAKDMMSRIDGVN